jgi:hypothetical protein
MAKITKHGKFRIKHSVILKACYGNLIMSLDIIRCMGKQELGKML